MMSVLLAACALSPDPDKAGDSRQTEWRISDQLSVTALKPGVWMHTTWQKFPGGPRFPSNGLLVKNGDGLVLVDTAWGHQQTVELFDWIDSVLGLPVQQAVITHFHSDRMAGSAVLQDRGIPLFAHPLTIELSAGGQPSPLDALSHLKPGETARIGNLEAFYPGPGHTRDNMMVWMAEARVLFGGCAVRPGSSVTLGNTEDADLDAWPDSIRRAQQRYPHADLVVPSHGPPGGVELLERMPGLFEKTDAPN